MTKNKVVGFIYCADNLLTLKKSFSNNLFHINNISKHFQDVYVLNLTNLYLFKKKIKDADKQFKQHKFNTNVKFYNPNNLNELKEFFDNKSFLGILCMKRTISELNIYYHLNKFNIKFFQISNIGNVQYGDKPVENNYIRSIFSIYWKKFNHKLFILLNIFGITPKIEIRFLSNSSWIKSSKNNQSLRHKITRFFNILYAKKLMIINSRAYDLFTQKDFPQSKKYIVLLEEYFDDPQYVEIRGYTDKKKLKHNYINIIEKLEAISNYLKKKIVICIHPSDNLRLKKKNIF